MTTIKQEQPEPCSKPTKDNLEQLTPTDVTVPVQDFVPIVSVEEGPGADSDRRDSSEGEIFTVIVPTTVSPHEKLEIIATSEKAGAKSLEAKLLESEATPSKPETTKGSELPELVEAREEAPLEISKTAGVKVAEQLGSKISEEVLLRSSIKQQVEEESEKAIETSPEFPKLVEHQRDTTPEATPEKTRASTHVEIPVISQQVATTDVVDSFARTESTDVVRKDAEEEKPKEEPRMGEPLASSEKEQEIEVQEPCFQIKDISPQEKDQEPDLPSQEKDSTHVHIDVSSGSKLHIEEPQKVLDSVGQAQPQLLKQGATEEIVPVLPFSEYGVDKIPSPGMDEAETVVVPQSGLVSQKEKETDEQALTLIPDTNQDQESQLPVVPLKADDDPTSITTDEIVVMEKITEQSQFQDEPSVPITENLDVIPPVETLNVPIEKFEEDNKFTTVTMPVNVEELSPEESEARSHPGDVVSSSQDANTKPDVASGTRETIQETKDKERVDQKTEFTESKLEEKAADVTTPEDDAARTEIIPASEDSHKITDEIAATPVTVSVEDGSMNVLTTVSVEVTAEHIPELSSPIGTSEPSDNIPTVKTEIVSKKPAKDSHPIKEEIDIIAEDTKQHLHTSIAEPDKLAASQGEKDVPLESAEYAAESAQQLLAESPSGKPEEKAVTKESKKLPVSVDKPVEELSSLKQPEEHLKIEDVQPQLEAQKVESEAVIPSGSESSEIIPPRGKIAAEGKTEILSAIVSQAPQEPLPEKETSETAQLAIDTAKPSPASADKGDSQAKEDVDVVVPAEIVEEKVEITQGEHPQKDSTTLVATSAAAEPSTVDQPTDSAVEITPTSVSAPDVPKEEEPLVSGEAIPPLAADAAVGEVETAEKEMQETSDEKVNDTDKIPSITCTEQPPFVEQKSTQEKPSDEEEKERSEVADETDADKVETPISIQPSASEISPAIVEAPREDSPLKEAMEVVPPSSDTSLAGDKAARVKVAEMPAKVEVISNAQVEDAAVSAASPEESKDVLEPTSILAAEGEVGDVSESPVEPSPVDTILAREKSPEAKKVLETPKEAKDEPAIVDSSEKATDITLIPTESLEKSAPEDKAEVPSEEGQSVSMAENLQPTESTPEISLDEATASLEEPVGVITVEPEEDAEVEQKKKSKKPKKKKKGKKETSPEESIEIPMGTGDTEFTKPAVEAETKTTYIPPSEPEEAKQAIPETIPETTQPVDNDKKGDSLQPSDLAGDSSVAPVEEIGKTPIDFDIPSQPFLSTTIVSQTEESEREQESLIEEIEMATPPSEKPEMKPKEESAAPALALATTVISKYEESEREQESLIEEIEIATPPSEEPEMKPEEETSGPTLALTTTVISKYEESEREQESLIEEIEFATPTPEQSLSLSPPPPVIKVEVDVKTTSAPEMFDAVTSPPPAAESKDVETTAKPQSVETSTSTSPPDTKSVHVTATPDTFDISTSPQKAEEESRDIHVQAGPETLDVSTASIQIDSKESGDSAAPVCFDAATSPPPSIEQKDAVTSITPPQMFMEETQTSIEKAEEIATPSESTAVETCEAQMSTEPVLTSDIATSPPPQLAQEWKDMEVSAIAESAEAATATSPPIFYIGEEAPTSQPPSPSVEAVNVKIKVSIKERTPDSEEPVEEVAAAKPPALKTADDQPEDDDKISSKKGRKKKKGKDRKQAQDKAQPAIDSKEPQAPLEGEAKDEIMEEGVHQTEDVDEGEFPGDKMKPEKSSAVEPEPVQPEDGSASQQLPAPQGDDSDSAKLQEMEMQTAEMEMGEDTPSLEEIKDDANDGKKRAKKSKKQKGKLALDAEVPAAIPSPEVQESLQSEEKDIKTEVPEQITSTEPEYFITEPGDNIQEQEVSLSVQPVPEELHMDTLSTLQNQIERSLNQPKGSQALMLVSQPEQESLESLQEKIDSLSVFDETRTFVITEWIEVITVITEVLETVRYWTQRIDHSPQGADEKRPQYENLQKQVKSLNTLLDAIEKVEGDDGQPLQSPLKEKIREVLNTTRAQSALAQQFLTDSQEALKVTHPDSAETKWDSESLSRQESQSSSSDQTPDTPPVQVDSAISPLAKESVKKKSSKKGSRKDTPITEEKVEDASKTSATTGLSIVIGATEAQPPEPVRVSVETPTPESQIQYVTKISSLTITPVVEIVESERQMRASSPPESVAKKEPQPPQKEPEEGITITLGHTESVLLTTDEALEQKAADDSNITAVPVTHFSSVDDVGEPTSETSPPAGKTHKMKKEKKKVTFEKKGSQEEFAKPVPVVEISGPPESELQVLEKVVNFKKELEKLLNSKPSTLFSGKIAENLTEELEKVTKRANQLQEQITTQEEVTIVKEILEIIETITILLRTLKRKSADLKEDASHTIPAKVEAHGTLHQNVHSVDNSLEKVKGSLDPFKMNPEVKDHLNDILSGTSSWSQQTNDALRENSDTLRKSLAEMESLHELIGSEKKDLHSFVDKLIELTEQPKVTPSDKLEQVDQIEPEFYKLKQDVYDNSEKVYKWCNENPSDCRQLTQQLGEVNELVMTTEALVAEEKDRLVQIMSLADEYEQTLQEFSQVIEVAEALVEEKLAVKNLQQLQDELQKNRNFFGNLKRCQQALEKLEYDLDASTREAHKELHQRLYHQSASILERAAKRRQQIAVASARWSRLEHGLNEERNWLSQASGKVPSLKAVASTDCERICSTFQALYSDIIVHQARLMQLRAVSESLLGTVQCQELEGKTDALVEDLLNVSNRITSGLQCLVGFRDAYSNYERLIHRLKSWLQKAEAKMDAIALQPQSQPYDFWELKAQLESQQPLKNECSTLLDSALRILPVTDESYIHDNFSNFEDRWSALSSVISQTEKASYIQTEADSPSVALAVRLNSMEKDVSEIKDCLEGMNIAVESEDDLYCYLEKLQILKAQILNKKLQLNTIKKDSQLEPKDAERIGTLLAGLSVIDVQVTEELETAHVIREKFATFGRMALKTRRLQDTLRARVDQWASFFELSQDILKQALQNCQSLDEDITNNHVDLEKMHQVVTSFPSSSHLSLSTGKLEHELHEMEATVHTLTARVQDLRKRVQEQLGCWQDYEHALNTVAQLLHHSQSTLDLVDSEPPATLHALHISERYLNNVEEALGNKGSILSSLQTQGEKLKAESPEDVQRQINESVERIRADWRSVEERLSRVKGTYSRAKDSWSVILSLKSEIAEWVRLIYPRVEGESGRSSRRTSGGEDGGDVESDLVKRLQNELPLYEEKMSELDKIAKELCMTLFCTEIPTGDIASESNGEGEYSVKDNDKNGGHTQIPLTIELEGLSRKLVFLRKYLSAVADQQEGVGEGGRKSDELFEQARATFTSVSSGIQSEEEPSVDRLSLIYEHLLSLGNAEGRMKAPQSSSPVPDSHLTELLHNSNKIFQQTFVEYLRVWKSLSERESSHEIFSLWENYLVQCQNYLKEPLPSSREQLIEDESLCKVYQTILNGQHSTLSERGEASPDFPVLEAKYLEIETKLVSRQNEIRTRLNSWKNYMKCQDSFATWLRNMEREKRGLELPFLQLKRLTATQSKIEMLLEKCCKGAELLDELKAAKDSLVPFASPELKLSLGQDVSSSNARFQNIQAALKTWLDHTNRLADMNDTFTLRSEKISQTLNDLSERLSDEKMPATFTNLNKYIAKLEKLQKEVEDVSQPLEEVRSCLYDMKSSISPADARLLNQKLWFLTQQHVELLSALQQNRSEAEEKVDLIPAFDTRCKNWLLWAKATQEKLQRTQYLTLDEYSKWLVKEAEPEISSKESTYEWLASNGKSLAEMTTGSEKKDLLGAVKQVNKLWHNLNEVVRQRIAKVTHLESMLSELDSRHEESLAKVKTLEKFVGAPVTFQELTSEEINSVVHSHEGEHKKLSGESCDVNQILNLGEVAAADCDELKMYQDAFRIRQQCESLDDSKVNLKHFKCKAWKHLLARFSKKTEALCQLREKSQSIDDGCEFVESLLSQAGSDLSRLEISTDGDPSSIAGVMSEAQSLQESLRALSPKVEDIGNEYCFIAKQVMTRNPSGKLSQRVKKIIHDWRSYQERGHGLIDLCHRKLLLSNFLSSSNAMEEYMQGVISRAEDALRELSASEDIERGERKLARLEQDLGQLRGLENEVDETGKALTGKDRSSEELVDDKQLALTRLKRSLEEKLVILKEALQSRESKDEPEDEKAIQVETLTKTAIQGLAAAAASAPSPLELDKEIQVETLFGKKSSPTEESSSDGQTTTQSDDQSITLTRVDIYLQELLKALEDSEESMSLVENLVGGSEDQPGQETTDSYENLVRALANTQSTVDHVRHLYQLLTDEHKISSELARKPEVEQLQDRLRSVEEKARAYGQKLRESSPSSKQVICPVCTPSQRGSWDSTLWRLEQWLNHADAKLKETTKKRPPSSLEQLEDAILSHRELILDLDSHRSLVYALTGVLTHLSKHGETRTMGQVELDKLRNRLKKALEQWKKVCHRAAAWQARLQIALIENQDFHMTISQYEEALNSVQETIHRMEPVDLRQPRKVIISKLRTFTDLKDGLARMEPELATLLQTAEQLFTNATAIEKEGTFRPSMGSSSTDQGDIFITPECSRVLERISDLNHRLKTLQKVCDAYVKHLSLVLQKGEDDQSAGEEAEALLSLSDQIIEQSGRSSSALARSASPQPSNSSNEREFRNGSVIIQSGRYLMRVVRASIPIQAMILLLLGAASLIPYGEQDFLCTARNTLQSSLEPMLHYPDGPPPI